MVRHFQHKQTGNVYAVTSRHVPNPALYTEVRVVPMDANEEAEAGALGDLITEAVTEHHISLTATDGELERFLVSHGVRVLGSPS